MTMARASSVERSGWWHSLAGAWSPRLSGYIPLGIVRRGTESRVRWIRAKQTAFREPFFTYTTTNLLNVALGSTVVETDLGALVRHSRRARRLTPSGFVFHVSRCGSTTVSNM